MLTRDIDLAILSVCLSVRLSRSDVLSERLNLFLPVLNILAKFRLGPPYGGIEYRWGII